MVSQRFFRDRINFPRTASQPDVPQSFNDFIQQNQPTSQNGTSEEVRRLIALARVGGPEGEQALRRLQQIPGGMELYSTRRLPSAPQAAFERRRDPVLPPGSSPDFLSFTGDGRPYLQSLGLGAVGKILEGDPLSFLPAFPALHGVAESIKFLADMKRPKATRPRFGTEEYKDEVQRIKERRISEIPEDANFWDRANAIQKINDLSSAEAQLNPKVSGSFPQIDTPIGTLGTLELAQFGSEMMMPVAGAPGAFLKGGKLGLGALGAGARAGATGARAGARAGAGVARQVAPIVKEATQEIGKATGKEFTDFVQQRFPAIAPRVMRFADEPLDAGRDIAASQAAKTAKETAERVRPDFVLPSNIKKEVLPYGKRTLTFESDLDYLAWTTSTPKMTPAQRTSKAVKINLFNKELNLRGVPAEEISRHVKALRDYVKRTASKQRGGESIVIPKYLSFRETEAKLIKTTPRGDKVLPTGTADSSSRLQTKALKPSSSKEEIEDIRAITQASDDRLKEAIKSAREAVERKHNPKIGKARSESARSRFINRRDLEIQQAERMAREKHIALEAESRPRVKAVKDIVLKDGARRKQPRPSSAAGGTIEDITKNLSGTSDEVAEHRFNTLDSDLLDPMVTEPGLAGKKYIGEDLINLGATRRERFLSKLSVLAPMKIEEKFNLKKRFLIHSESKAATEINKRVEQIRSNASTNAGRFILAIAPKIKKAFVFDDKGRIPSLAGIDPLLKSDTGVPLAPTIQDVAARYPRFEKVLSEDQQEVFRLLREEFESDAQVLIDIGKTFGTRPDVMRGGFYLPRGMANKSTDKNTVTIYRENYLGKQEEILDPITGEVPEILKAKYDGGVARSTTPISGVPKSTYLHKSVQRSMTQAMEPHIATIDDRVEDILVNKEIVVEYPDFIKTIQDFKTQVGEDTSLYFLRETLKTLKNEDGNLIWRTRKSLLFLDPRYSKAHKQWTTFKNAFKRLDSLYSKKNNKLLQKVQWFVENPDELDFDGLQTFLDSEQIVQAGTLKGATLKELRKAYTDLKVEFKNVKKLYDEAGREFNAQSRGWEEVDGIYGLKGMLFPQIMATKLNKFALDYLKPGSTSWVERMKAIEELNNVLKASTATLDNSAIGIQLMLLSYSNPGIVGRAARASLATMMSGEDAMRAILSDFDTKILNRGSGLTSEQWVTYGAEIAATNPEVHSSVLTKGLGLDYLFKKTGIPLSPGAIFRRPDHMFANVRNSAVLDFCDELFMEEMLTRGITQEEMIRSGLARKITETANLATGWKEGNFTLGNFVLYSTRFLMARALMALRAFKGLDVDVIYDIVPPIPTGFSKGRVTSWTRGRQLEYAVQQRLGKSLRINKYASIQDRYARRLITRMLSYGALMTWGINQLRGEETDFNPLVKHNGKTRINYNFMKIRNVWGRDWSVFGPYHSLFNTVLAMPVLASSKEPEVQDFLKRNTTAPLAALTWDLTTNTGFGGKHIWADDDSFIEKLRSGAEYTAIENMPFSVQEGAEHIAPLIKAAKEITSNEEIEWGEVSQDVAQGLAGLGSEMIGIYSSALSTGDMIAILENDESLSNKERHELYVAIDENSLEKEKDILPPKYSDISYKWKNDVFKKYGKSFKDLTLPEREDLSTSPLGKTRRLLDVIKYGAFEEADAMDRLDSGTIWRVKRNDIDADTVDKTNAVTKKFKAKVQRFGPYLAGNEREFRQALNDFDSEIDGIIKNAIYRKSILRKSLFGDNGLETGRHEPNAKIDTQINKYYSYTSQDKITKPTYRQARIEDIAINRERILSDEEYRDLLIAGVAPFEDRFDSDAYKKQVDSRDAWLGDLDEDTQIAILKYVNRNRDPLTEAILAERQPIEGVVELHYRTADAQFATIKTLFNAYPDPKAAEFFQEKVQPTKEYRNLMPSLLGDKLSGIKK